MWWFYYLKSQRDSMSYTLFYSCCITFMIEWVSTLNYVKWIIVIGRIEDFCNSCQNFSIYYLGTNWKFLIIYENEWTPSHHEGHTIFVHQVNVYSKLYVEWSHTKQNEAWKLWTDWRSLMEFHHPMIEWREWLFHQHLEFWN